MYKAEWKGEALETCSVVNCQGDSKLLGCTWN